MIIRIPLLVKTEDLALAQLTQDMGGSDEFVCCDGRNKKTPARDKSRGRGFVRGANASQFTSTAIRLATWWSYLWLISSLADTACWATR
jgi:hypothetical protein